MFRYPVVKQPLLYDLKKSSDEFNSLMNDFSKLKTDLILKTCSDKPALEDGLLSFKEAQKLDPLWQKIIHTRVHMCSYITTLSGYTDDSDDKPLLDDEEDDSQDNLTVANVKEEINNGGVFDSKEFRNILNEVTNIFPDGPTKLKIAKLTNLLFNNFSETKIALLRLLANPPDAPTLRQRSHTF